MPIEVKWYIPYRVIDARMFARVTVEHIEQHCDLMIETLKECAIHYPGHKIYLILDASEVESIPNHYLMLKQALPLLRMKNRGPILQITQNRRIRTIMSIGAHIMQFEAENFSTRVDALKALEASMLQEDLYSRGTSKN